jgi:CheY-like chemotaxis protein
MTVLLIDDDPISLRVLAMTVGRLGLPAVAVASGAAALAWLAEHPECSLVITDLGMPGITGLDVFIAMRDDPRWATIPVVVCTGAADSATVRDAIGRGVRHYIVKPIKPSVIAAKVLELAPHAASPVAKAAPDAPTGQPPATDAGAPSSVDPTRAAPDAATTSDGTAPPDETATPSDETDLPAAADGAPRAADTESGEPADDAEPADTADTAEPAEPADVADVADVADAA